MDGALRGLGVHALPEELHVLQLLRHQTSEYGGLLGAHGCGRLAVEKVLGHDRAR